MAVQIPDPGTGNGQTGDNEYVFRKKVKDNFSDQTNAASKLVGATAGRVPLAEQSAYASFNFYPSGVVTSTNPDAFKSLSPGIHYMGLSADISKMPYSYNNILTFNGYGNSRLQVYYGYTRNDDNLYYRIKPYGDSEMHDSYYMIYSTANTTKDANGFLKGASPVIDMYDNKIELNHDAQRQGGITFEKLGVGDYLVKGSLGFAQEGWHIETPKDTNGNVLVAVVEKQLENNDLSIKTYAKRFDDETGDIVPNLLKPRDIPTGRFISLRLHELPKEPPVMPPETQKEV